MQLVELKMPKSNNNKRPKKRSANIFLISSLIISIPPPHPLPPEYLVPELIEGLEEKNTITLEDIGVFRKKRHLQYNKYELRM